MVAIAPIIILYCMIMANQEIKMYELKLLQLNLGHRRAASYDLQLRTRNMKDFIALI